MTNKENYYYWLGCAIGTLGGVIGSIVAHSIIY
jgi:hypothetical protein